MTAGEINLGERIRLQAENCTAGELVEALLVFPVEFRRELYRLITGDFAESFNAAPRAKSTKVHGPIKGSPRKGRRS